MNETAELARKLRACDMLKLTKGELDGSCQQLGISARGTREELIERLANVIWQSKFDDE